MMEKRRQWTGEEILGLLRPILVEREEISKICQESGACPSQVYRWQARLFSKGAAVFQRKKGARSAQRSGTAAPAWPQARSGWTAKT